jgi:ABC-type nitrate/sulfonate/bicarbonate transport system ATPase subunit/ABC-type nitrate/sulfonate/bicarbonate transport system permease component
LKWRILQVSLLLAFLAMWQLAAMRHEQSLIPSPRSCLAALQEMAQQGVLLTACVTSLQRVVVGFALAVVAGVIVGVTIGLVPVLQKSVSPFFELLRPIPPIAWIPITVSVLGIGDASAYFIIFIGAFFPILTNMVLGVTTIERAYLDVANVFGASPWRSFIHVILPSSLPSAFAGLRVGMGFAWMCVVAAEMFAARSGLGYEIQLSRQLFRLDRVVACMVVIGAIGWAMSRSMTYLEWFALPWRREFLTRDGLSAVNVAASKLELEKSTGDSSQPRSEVVERIEESLRVDGARIEIRNLSFAYSRGPMVLREINLDIQPGEVFCILGKSGCGKSTLLRLLAGLETQFEGAISINGVAPETKRADVTMAFQHASLFPWKTAAGNIRFALRSKESDGTLAAQVCNSVLSLVGLRHKSASYPHQLSGGQQQRVAMARAIACHPRLVLLDEPLSSLDNYTRETLQNEISSLLYRSGITTVLVTHDIAEAIFMSDRIALMAPEGGHIVQIFEVRQPRPRPEAFRTDEAFAHLHATIWAEMRSTHGMQTT